jgi:hypothetical protein
VRFGFRYRDAQYDANPVADLRCFFNERVDLEVDGEPIDHTPSGPGTTNEPKRPRLPGPGPEFWAARGGQ